MSFKGLIDQKSGQPNREHHGLRLIRCISTKILLHETPGHVIRQISIDMSEITTNISSRSISDSLCHIQYKDFWSMILVFI